MVNFVQLSVCFISKYNAKVHNTFAQTRGQKKVTTNKNIEDNNGCPAEGLLKMLSGKWKPQIFRHAVEGPVRFNTLIKEISGANKQSVSVALKELEEVGLLSRTVISEKPLHVEYNLTESGRSLIPVFRQLEFLAG